MSAKTFYIKLGDRLPSLGCTLLDDTGVAQDVTGATVKFAVRRKNTKPALLDASATVVTAASGIVRYDWAAGDTATLLGVGDFEGEFQVTLANGKVGTFPGDGYIPIVVTRDIAT